MAVPYLIIHEEMRRYETKDSMVFVTHFRGGILEELCGLSSEVTRGVSSFVACNGQCYALWLAVEVVFVGIDDWAVENG
jgi:hypothetical protein